MTDDTLSHRRALALDLETLALLHDVEPDRALIEELRQAPFQEWLGLTLEGARGRAGLLMIDDALCAMPRPLDQATLDRLAVDFADIYLTFGLRAAPTASPWLDEEGLERQAPMFEARRWYQHYGLEVEDWRRRSDDHLVPELRFLAHLFRQAQGDWPLRDAASFMDAHLLRWLPRFAARVAARCRTPYFAGVVTLTAAYVDELRDILVLLTGDARPPLAPPVVKGRAAAGDEARSAPSYMPGVGPGW